MNKFFLRGWNIGYISFLIFAICLVSCTKPEPSTRFSFCVRNESESDVYVYASFSNYHETNQSRRLYRNDSVFYFLPKEESYLRTIYDQSFDGEELHVNPIQWFQSEFPDGEIRIYDRIWTHDDGYGPGPCVAQFNLNNTQLEFYEDSDMVKTHRYYVVYFVWNGVSNDE